jgi:hypothetical protein
MPGDPALHDLIPLGPLLPDAPTAAEMDATMAYVEAEKALLGPATSGAVNLNYRRPSRS